MNETPATPAAPRAADPATDTHSRAVEATGGPPAPVVDSETRVHAPGTAAHIGEYAVVAKVGEGGMGAVYLAEDAKLRRRVAIKTMRPELAANRLDRERFLREARAAAAVESDHIVPILHVGEAADGTPYIAMPFLKGEMLQDRLRREPVAPPGLVLKVAAEVALGLAAAHERGLIHRDIKPGNIWLEGDGAGPDRPVRRCKVLDFGLARSVEAEDVQVTASGAILGTPAFMAPEQARGEKVDHRADLWSLGVTLYRMATGRLPFKGPTAMATLLSVTTDAPSPVRALAPELPPAAADLIDRLMSKDPAGRPQSAAEVSAIVRTIVKGLQAPTAPGAPSVPVPAVPVYVLPAPAPNPWEEVTEADSSAQLVEPPERPAASRRGLRFVIGGLLGLLVLGAALVAVIVRIETAEGTLVVELNDAEVEAKIKNGKLVLVGPDGKERYTLSPTAERDKRIDAGAYTIRVEGADGLVLDTREFTLKRNGQVTVRVYLDPKLAKKPAPKKDARGTAGADFREVHGATDAELEKWMNGLRGDGFIPVYLSAEAGPAPRLNAVAVPNPAKAPWRFIPREVIDSAALNRIGREQRDAGFRHTLCCWYDDADRRFEWSVWIADGRPWGGWGGDRAFVTDKLKERADKFRPICLNVQRDGTVFQFLVGPDGARDWDAQLGLTATELAEYVATQRKKGWRLDWLSAYRVKDEVRFQAVSVEDTTRAEWEFRSDLPAKEYEARLAENAACGFRPRSVASYARDGQTRYAAVWVAEPNLAADRKAAEHVLSLGGRVRVSLGDR